MSTAKTIIYNSQGSNNIYPNAGAADFSDGSLKAGINPQPLSITPDLSLIDDQYFEYVDGKLRQKNQHSPKNVLVALWNSTGALTFTEGVTVSYQPTISGGWPVAGAHNFIYGIPAGSDKYNFSFQKKFGAVGAGFSSQYIVTFNSTNKIQIGNEGSSQILVRIQTDVGGTETFIFPCSYLSLTDRFISVDFVNKVGAVNGSLNVYLDGEYLGEAVLTNQIDTSAFSNLQLVSGQVTRYHTIATEVLHSKEDYTAAPPPANAFAESNIRLISESRNKDISALTSFSDSSNVQNTVKYTVNGKYLDGSFNWVASNNTRAQANPSSLISDFKGSLTFTDEQIFYVDAYFASSNVRYSLNSLSASVNLDYFYEVVNLTTTGDSIKATELVKFDSVHYDHAGAYIFVWLIADGVWYWYNELNSAWEESDKTFFQSNTIQVQKDHIDSFAFNGEIKKIDHSITIYSPIDNEGYQVDVSPSIEWVLYEYEQYSISLPPPSETTLIGMVRDTCTDSSTVPLRISNDTPFIYESVIMPKDSCLVEPDAAVGTYSKGIYESESINRAYKIESGYEKLNKISGAIDIKFDLIGYAVIPDVDKIKLTELVFGSSEEEAKTYFDLWDQAGRPLPLPPEFQTLNGGDPTTYTP